MYPPGGGPSYTGRNRNVRDGGPTGVQRSYASELREHEALFSTYEHLQGLPRGDAALTLLRKVASMVKPIMRKRGWHVRTLAEFLPAEANLLGLNINRGAKICIRLRYHNNPDLFLPIEQITDTMLHELSHNIWGDHDSNFHRLWDELRDEYETLAIKGFTGEGFLGRGQRLGGRNTAHSPQEVRRLARASAERRQSQLGLANGSGQRLGGRPLHNGHDTRDVITEQVRLRATVNRGCGSSRNDANVLAGAQNTFKTQAEENDANDRAIAEALFDLMEAEETAKLNGTYQKSPIEGGLSWTKERGLYEAIDLTQDDIPSEDDQMRWAIAESERLAIGDTNNDYGGLPPESLVSPMTPATQADSARPESLASRLRRASVVSPLSPESTPTPKRAAASPPSSLTPIMDLSEPFNPDEWACEVCTCVNPMQFLACDACGVERSKNVAKKKPRMGYSALPRRPPLEVTMSHSAVPRPRPLPPAESNGPPGIGWNCANCGAFMEHKWWTCSACGLMKDSS